MQQNKDSNLEMLKGSLIASFTVGVISLVASTLIVGKTGLLGALLAHFVVLVFFLVSVGIAILTKDASPVFVMALVLFSYFAKLLILGAIMFLISKYVSEENLNRSSFGVTAIVLTFAWLTGEVRAFLRLKLHLPLPE
ncbi:MAG: hypothetical protein ACKOCL_02335 [Candidatus Nanopelagicaceae bacterium]